MRTLTALLTLALFTAALPGCYYTATDRQGRTRQVSRQEFKKLDAKPAATPRDFSAPTPTPAEAATPR